MLPPQPTDATYAAIMDEAREPQRSATTRCVVLLRGVNVGKHNRIAMADFRTLLAELGATDVRTLLQSGNAVVTAEPEELAGAVEVALSERFGLSVRALVRTVDQIDRVIAACPFPEKAAAEPKMLHVAFLEHPLGPENPDDAEAVRAFGLVHGEDELAMGELDLYLCYGRSSLDSPINKVLSRLSGVASARNWNTVLKLRDLLRD
jgi:uncharacterized protein (DUF1697 family)